MRHAEAAELLGAFALDAVDDAEREALEEHVRECDRCRREVDQHREVAALLAHDVGRPPQGLWDRIAGELEEPPPAPLVAPVVPFGPVRRQMRIRVAAVAASVAAAVLIAGLSVRVVDDRRRLDAMARVAHEGDLHRVMNAALADPRARKVELRSPDGRRSAEAVVMPDGTGYLVSTELPPVPDDQTYQLWALVGDRKVSAGVLGSTPRPSPFTVDGELSGLAITVETAGGAVSPHGEPAAVGRVAVRT
jgi:hypothetical protein